MCWLKKGCFKIHATSVFRDGIEWGCVILMKIKEVAWVFLSLCWGCENFNALEIPGKLPGKKLNNQYIYYVIKNTGCNIARCSALILISLVSLSGTRSYGELQTKIFSAFFYFWFLIQSNCICQKRLIAFSLATPARLWLSQKLLQVNEQRNKVKTKSHNKSFFSSFRKSCKQNFLHAHSNVSYFTPNHAYLCLHSKTQTCILCSCVLKHKSICLFSRTH